MRKAGAAHKDAPDLLQTDGGIGLFQLKGGRDHGKIRTPFLHVGKHLGGGAVADADLHVRMLSLKIGEAVKEQAVQGRFRSADADGAAVQPKGQAELLLSPQDPFAGGRHVTVQKLSLRREGDAVVGTDEEAAAQLAFQILDAPGDRRLAGKHRVCGFGEVTVFGYIIEHFIVIKACVHGKSPVVFI